MADEITLVLSAGHRSSSPGACTPGGLKEYLLTAEYVGALKDALGERGISDGVVLVPQHWSLVKRQEYLRQILKEHPHALAVEFHFNAFNGRAKGAEAFVGVGNKLVFDAIGPWLHLSSEELMLANRGLKVPAQSARGSLGWCSAGGCIWEICFMDNPHDLVKVKPAVRWAKAMAETLIKSGVYRNSGIQGRDI